MTISTYSSASGSKWRISNGMTSSKSLTKFATSRGLHWRSTPCAVHPQMNATRAPFSIKPVASLSVGNTAIANSPTRSIIHGDSKLTKKSCANLFLIRESNLRARYCRSLIIRSPLQHESLPEKVPRPPDCDRSSFVEVASKNITERHLPSRVSKYAPAIRAAPRSLSFSNPS